MRITLMMAIAFTLVSCATITKGRKETVNFKSEPPCALVKTHNDQCKTPCVLDLQRGQDYTVEISKDGFEPQKVIFNGKWMNGWIWGNLLIGGILGVGIDYGTGAAYSFEQPFQNYVLKRGSDNELTRLPASVPNK